MPYGKFFVGYKEAIAFKESQGKYKKLTRWGIWVNTSLIKETLKTVGIHDSSRFEQSENAGKSFCGVAGQKQVGVKDIDKYRGQRVVGDSNH